MGSNWQGESDGPVVEGGSNKVKEEISIFKFRKKKFQWWIFFKRLHL